MTRTDIRLALPSKGRLEQPTLDFLAAAGLKVSKPNPRQYFARIPAIPELTVMFQRPGDIAVSVREGGVDFGLAGLDAVAERSSDDGEILMLHEALGFGRCTLSLAVPEDWPERTLSELSASVRARAAPLRVATQYPNLTRRFLGNAGIGDAHLITAEGTLEVAPTIGYADVIVDLVSSGQTLRDNRLRPIEDGAVLRSQAVLFANRSTLERRPQALAIARQLLEYIEAHLRGQENYMVVANMRGGEPEEVARKLFAEPELGGLQGPTIAPVFTRGGERWHSVTIIVHKDRIIPAVRALRSAGGSGVIVSPVTYIFEEEPERARKLDHLIART
jgi:ATP phosphoribosyltransferase